MKTVTFIIKVDASIEPEESDGLYHDTYSRKKDISPTRNIVFEGVYGILKAKQYTVASITVESEDE